MKNPARNLSTGAAARRIGTTDNRIRKLCEAFPGFAIRLGLGWWEIPAEHVERLLAGDSAEDISAEVLARRAQMNVTTHKLSEGNLTEIIEFYDTPTQLAQSFRSELIREISRLYNFNRGLKTIVIQDFADASLEAAAIKELAATGGVGIKDPLSQLA